MIESLQNKTIKDLVRLQTKKERDRSGLFLIEGAHMIEEAQKAGCLTKVFRKESAPDIEGVENIVCSDPVMAKISQSDSGASLVGVCSKPVFENREASSYLVLDRIQDPGNMGTLIRSAFAFGCEKILLLPGCADPYNFKTLQSSQGAVFFEPIETLSAVEDLAFLKDRNIPLLGAALHQNSISLKNFTVPQKWAIAIGNEGRGLSQACLDLCDVTIFIEMKDFESLNAGVAGSILLYMFQK